MSYADLLSGKVSLPPMASVAIVGAGGIGFDVAEFLTHATPAHATNAGGGGGIPPAAMADEAAIEAFMREWEVDTGHAGRGGLAAKGAAQGAPAADETAAQREVFLLQRTKGKPGAGLGKTTGWIHRATLAKAGVKMVGGVLAYEKVDDAGLHVRLPQVTSPVKASAHASGEATRALAVTHK